MAKVDIDLSNVITSKDQLRIGMPLWGVGAGGTVPPQKPSYAGQIIGFGSADYTFTAGAERATGFVIKDETKYDLAVLVYPRGDEVRTFAVPEAGYAKDTVHPMTDFEGEVYVGSRSVLPEPYHNWYFCDNPEKAEAVFTEMSAKWSAEHEADRLEYKAVMDASEAYMDCEPDYDYDPD